MANSRSASIAALSSSFLAGLERPAADAILAAAQIQRISAKSTISTEGYRATRLVLVQSGQAHFYHVTKQGDLVLLALLVPGDVIGLVTIMKRPPPYMATAVAISDCEVLAWEHSVIRNLASLHPLLAENAFRISLGYLRTFIDRHAGLVTKTAEERLAKILVRLSDQSGRFHPEGIEIRATNDELGALADISPFTASRVLNNWVHTGVVSKGRGRVFLHAPEALMVG
jgi:CRP/FNR family transcriptional regulator, nitrogen oxide reductase regulator